MERGPKRASDAKIPFAHHGAPSPEGAVVLTCGFSVGDTGIELLRASPPRTRRSRSARCKLAGQKAYSGPRDRRQMVTNSVAFGRSCSPYVPRGTGIGRMMAREQTENRRGFGRIEKRESGRYRAAYTGPDGRLYRAPMTFDARDDAIAWLSARRAEIQMEVWAPAAAARAAFRRDVPTLRAYGDKWLDNRRTRGRELRPTTRQQYRMILDTYIYPTFGDEPLDLISADLVNRWYDALAPGKETIRAQAYSLLRTIFTSAASERPEPLVPYNPAHIRGAGNTTRLHKVGPASLAELETIVEELPDRYKAMALLAAWCAMRFGELTELRRKDIDLRNNRVKITRGVVRVDGKFIVGPPKSDAGVRDVAIPPHLLPAVKAHLKDHTKPGKDALLFPAAESESHMAPSTLYK